MSPVGSKRVQQRRVQWCTLADVQTTPHSEPNGPQLHCLIPSSNSYRLMCSCMHGPLCIGLEKTQEVDCDCKNSARQTWSWAAMASVLQCVQRCELPGQTWNRSASRCLGFLWVLLIVVDMVSSDRLCHLEPFLFLRKCQVHRVSKMNN